jgi:hypothetical protein
MLRHVALVRTDVSVERIPSTISVIKIWELGTKLAGTSNRSTLRRNTISVLHYSLFPRGVSLLVTANVVPSSSILALMLEAIRSTEKIGFYKSHTA